MGDQAREYVAVGFQQRRWMSLGVPIFIFSFVVIQFFIYSWPKINNAQDKQLALMLLLGITAICFLIIWIGDIVGRVFGKVLKKNIKVSILHEGIVIKCCGMSHKILFHSIRSIDVVSEANLPKYMKFLFQIKGLKGIKIEKDGNFFIKQKRYVFIENLDCFLAELREKMPYDLSQQIIN